MSNPFLSVIIPTFNRVGLLHLHLRELANQTLDPKHFEVIVVEDGGQDSVGMFPWKDMPYSLQFLHQENNGPASARNLGARYAKGEILLFVGDDCLPNRHMLYYHFLRHKQSGRPMALQGYTDWHPGIPPDDFHQWLHGNLPPTGGGLQANWNALKNKDGSWISRDQELQGWGLTTQYSIAKSEFERLGGFNELFKEAAWEDVELALRASVFKCPTFFFPDAVNYHHHRQTLDGFINRQIKEGRWRLTLCSVRPEMSSNLIDPAGLRNTNADMLKVAVAKARELHYSPYPEIQEIRQKRWYEACMLASLEGLRQDIKKRGGVWQALLHVHTNDQVLHLVQAAASLDRGDPHYAIFSMEWCLKDSPSNWAILAAYSEVMLASGDKETAKQYAIRASELGAGEKWPMELLEKLK